MCTREPGAIFDAGGLQCTLTFINEFGRHVHKDTLHSAMSVVSRLCSRMEPQDTQLESCVHSLSNLLKHEDAFVSIKEVQYSDVSYCIICSHLLLVDKLGHVLYFLFLEF